MKETALHMLRKHIVQKQNSGKRNSFLMLSSMRNDDHITFLELLFHMSPVIKISCSLHSLRLIGHASRAKQPIDEISMSESSKAKAQDKINFLLELMKFIELMSVTAL